MSDRNENTDDIEDWWDPDAKELARYRAKEAAEDAARAEAAVIRSPFNDDEPIRVQMDRKRALADAAGVTAEDSLAAAINDIALAALAGDPRVLVDPNPAGR